ncbi:acetyltransferase, GNAT family [Necator americanus]|nr:acetyltransferase, GNAT family [Necator americanus]ETN73562.1 acetyltransferase, GNAT family [Necator americanus]
MPMLPPFVSIPLNQPDGEEADDAEYMFNPELLTPEIVGQVQNGFLVRPLKLSDYDNGFLGVLAQLTTVGEISREIFEERFKSMSKTRPLAYFVVVIEDLSTGRVVAAATLVIEWKFIHEAGCRGRVEDVVVDKEMRGKKMGALLNRILVALAKQIGVYKLSLECKDSLIPFYELYGYQKDLGNNFLVQRFDRDQEINVPCEDVGEIRIPSNI